MTARAASPAAHAAKSRLTGTSAPFRFGPPLLAGTSVAIIVSVATTDLQVPGWLGVACIAALPLAALLFLYAQLAAVWREHTRAFFDGAGPELETRARALLADGRKAEARQLVATKLVRAHMAATYVRFLPEIDPPVPSGDPSA